MYSVLLELERAALSGSALEGSHGSGWRVSLML